MAGRQPEAEVCGIIIPRIVLPNGYVKYNETLSTKHTVKQVKATLLDSIGIFTPNDYRMVFYNADNSAEQLDGEEKLQKYSELLAQGVDTRIEIVMTEQADGASMFMPRV